MKVNKLIYALEDCKILNGNVDVQVVFTFTEGWPPFEIDCVVDSYDEVDDAKVIYIYIKPDTLIKEIDQYILQVDKAIQEAKKQEEA
jgi:hypothetical protein